MRRFIHSHLSPLFFLFFLILFLLLLLLFIFGLPLAFEELGIPGMLAIYLLFFSFIGSTVNIPVKTWFIKHPSMADRVRFWGITYSIPRMKEDTMVLSINLGGAIIPLVIVFYQFFRIIIVFQSASMLLQVLFATSLTTLLCYFIARPVKGIGIAMPALIPPVSAAIVALLLSPGMPAVTAYCAGTLGTLIGADILNLSKIKKLNAPMVSIGGAGTFDGIFLSGIIAVLLV